jgi:hypothetical protein
MEVRRAVESEGLKTGDRNSRRHGHNQMKHRHIDMTDFPDEVYASALKFEQHAARHGPPNSKAAWLDFAFTLDIPQEHLELILARIWSQPVETIRAIYRRGQRYEN